MQQVGEVVIKTYIYTLTIYANCVYVLEKICKEGVSAPGAMGKCLIVADLGIGKGGSAVTTPCTLACAVYDLRGYIRL